MNVSRPQTWETFIDLVARDLNITVEIMINDPGCKNRLKTGFAKGRICQTRPQQRDNYSGTSQEKKITTTCGAGNEKPFAATGPLQQTFIKQHEGSQSFKIIHFNNEDTAS